MAGASTCQALLARALARTALAQRGLSTWSNAPLGVRAGSAGDRHFSNTHLHQAAADADFLSLALQNAVTPSVCAALVNGGFAVIDNLFSERICSDLRNEIKGLADNGKLHINSTHLVNGTSRSLLEKANILETEVLEQDATSVAPLSLKLISDETLLTMINVLLPGIGLSTQTFKLQYNAGGAFPIHTDNDEEVDGRRISGILYLNPSWQPKHGGMLRLYPWPSRSVDIEPLSGRLVLFSSCRMLHRVLPSFAPRYCYLIWLSVSPSRAARSVPQQPLSKLLQSLPRTEEAGQDAFEKVLSHPKGHLFLAKVSLAQEWAQSLVESHPDSPARSLTISNFWREVDFLRKQFLEHGFSKTADTSYTLSRPLQWL